MNNVVLSNQVEQPINKVYLAAGRFLQLSAKCEKFNDLFYGYLLICYIMLCKFVRKCRTNTYELTV